MVPGRGGAVSFHWEILLRVDSKIFSNNAFVIISFQYWILFVLRIRIWRNFVAAGGIELVLLSRLTDKFCSNSGVLKVVFSDNSSNTIPG